MCITWYTLCVFSGIITNLGKLNNKKGAVLTFSTNQAFCREISKGESIAINGICLTVFKRPTNNSFSIEVMPETQNKTILRYLKTNDLVNLELPLTPQSLLSGHIVTGHADGVAKLESITEQGNSRILKLSIPTTLSKYLAEKGSIAVNGISLTIIEVKKGYFTVGIIPYTWNNTMLRTIKLGDFANIEVDILAKYLSKLLKK